MRKFLLILALLLVPALAHAQGIRSFSSAAPASDVGIPMAGTGVAYHKLTWTTSGTVSACTVALDSSSDGVSWSAGGVITGQTCTSPGSSLIVNSNVNFIRITFTALSGGGTVTATWNGYVNNPASGSAFNGGSGTSFQDVLLISSPGNPASGYIRLYGDSGTGNFTCLTSSGGSCASGGGSGTVTVVGAGSLTSTAIVTGGGTTTIQTPSPTSTLDSSGNMVLAGSLTAGGALAAGSSCTPMGASAHGGVCMGENASTGWTPTSGFDYIRGDSGHLLEASLNGVAEAPLVQGPTSSTAGYLAVFSNTTGNILKNGGLFSCTEVWGGSGTSFAMQSGDDLIVKNGCYNDSGVTRTIVAVKCRSDNGSNTTTVNPTFGSDGTGTTILSGALTCGNSYAYSSSGTVSNASWTTGTGIAPGMATVGNATSIALIVEYHY